MLNNKLFDLDDSEKKYTRLIDSIKYTPKKIVPPSVFSLADTKKYNELLDAIQSKNFPPEVKRFLELAATRFIVFDYQEIAEYYCHVDKDLQEIMEKLALVIIDFDDALEYGLVKLDKNLRNFILTRGGQQNEGK